MKPIPMFCAINLIHTHASFPPFARVSALSDFFQTHPIPFIAIVQNNCPVGMISRENLYRRLRSPDGVVLYSDKPVSFLVQKNVLMVDGSTNYRELFRLAFQRPTEQQGEDILIHLDGVYQGLVSTRSLLKFNLEELDRLFSCQLELQQCLELEWKKLKSLSKKSIITSCLSTFQGSPSNPILPRASIEGGLTSTTPMELFRLFMRHRESGCLQLHGVQDKKTNEFSIYFSKGRLVHATGPSTLGIQALLQASLIRHGRFGFVFEKRTFIQTLSFSQETSNTTPPSMNHSLELLPNHHTDDISLSQPLSTLA